MEIRGRQTASQRKSPAEPRRAKQHFSFMPHENMTQLYHYTYVGDPIPVPYRRRLNSNKVNCTIWIEYELI